MWLKESGTAFNFDTDIISSNITLKPSWVKIGATEAPTITWKGDTSDTLIIGANVTEATLKITLISSATIVKRHKPLLTSLTQIL